MKHIKLFGTDGIRGAANEPPMTIEIATKLGQALACKYRVPGHKTNILIGKDTRLSNYMFEAALACGINSMGGNVYFLGPLPTPGIAYLTQSTRVDAGIVISASHNPFYDNGIKIFGRDGFKLPDNTEKEIENFIFNELPEIPCHKHEKIGRSKRIDDAVGRYIVFLKHVFPRELTLEGMKIVIDCANGAAYKVAPETLMELGATVLALGNSPNGTNINKGVGSLHPEKASKLVLESGAQIGITLDGDADRCLFVDEKGEVVDGDEIMAICANHMVNRGKLRNNTVVATVMSNLGLEVCLRKMRIQLTRTKVGDRYVVERMRAGDFNLGGEQSGHVIFLDHSTTGDGMIAALKILTIMQESGKPLSELKKIMAHFPQVLINKKVSHKPPLEELPSVQRHIGQLEKELGIEGRVLVRYSGTEAKVRVMLEGTNQDKITEYANDLVATIINAIDSP